jgi:ABC-type uncharacterized transport system permease subunit
MQIKFISPTSSNPPSLLRKAGTIVATTVMVGVALMFSAVLLTVVLSIGALAFTYLWWKTRGLRKQMREQMRDFPPPGANVEREAFRDEVHEGEVIEGEAVRVDEQCDRIAR